MRASYIWAALILIVIGGWLASGQIIVGGQGDTTDVPANVSEDAVIEEGPVQAAEDQPFRVRVANLTVEERESEITLRGRTEAKRRVTVRSQTSGLVEELAVSKGQRVEAADILCRIETGSREAQVMRAEAGVAQAELGYNAATTLSERGHGAEARLREAKAALDTARAELSEAELELRRATMRAPFDGVVAELPAENGALLGIGDTCAKMVAQSPMLVVTNVSERDVGRLETGLPARVRLVTGDEAMGEITYIAPSAEPGTRTFRVDVEVANDDGQLRDGITASVQVALDTAPAHRFSPSILTLNDGGQVGVRTVDEDNRVQFVPVEILDETRDHVWAAGLPDTVTVITVGQDYVREGALVDPVFETAEARP